MIECANETVTLKLKKGTIVIGTTISVSHSLNTDTIDPPAQRCDKIHFTKQRANQSGSALLCLPAEIRLLILKELLVTDLMLDRRVEYDRALCDQAASEGQADDDSQVLSGYRLHPAILIACQTLLLESRPVLYGQNTWAIYMTLETFNAKKGRQSPLCLWIPVIQSRADYFTYPTLPDHVDFVNFLDQVQRLQLHVLGSIIASDAERVGTAMQHLAPILMNKQVKFVVDADIISESQVLELSNALQTLQFLRCQGFQIQLGDMPRAEVQVRPIPGLENVVTSGTEVKTLITCLDACSRLVSLMSAECWDMVRKLKEATYTFNVDAFVKARDDLVVQALGENKLDEKDLRTIYDHDETLDEVRSQQSDFLALVQKGSSDIKHITTTSESVSCRWLS